MDAELLLMLIMLWGASSLALGKFLLFWFGGGGACFHPHSLNYDDRHASFLVTSSKTICKYDCVVKSISAFVAPRGSSSSQTFAILTVWLAIAGIAGSWRWHAVGDATLFQAQLGMTGFASLLVVVSYELDISSEKFLEDKILVFVWFMKKLLETHPLQLPFRMDSNDEGLRRFISDEESLAKFFPELAEPRRTLRVRRRAVRWMFLHMLGSVIYVFGVIGAVVLNEAEDLHAGIVTMCFFGTFCFCSYLTGEYFPVVRFMRFYIMVWNPFAVDQNFLSIMYNALQRVSVNVTNDNKDIDGDDQRDGRIIKNAIGHIAVMESENDRSPRAIRLSRRRCARSNSGERLNRHHPHLDRQRVINEELVLDTPILRLCQARYCRPSSRQRQNTLLLLTSTQCIKLFALSSAVLSQTQAS